MGIFSPPPVAGPPRAVSPPPTSPPSPAPAPPPPPPGNDEPLPPLAPPVTPAVPDVPVAGVNPEPADRDFPTPSPAPAAPSDAGETVAELIEDAEAEDAAARDGLNGGGETTLGEGAARGDTAEDGGNAAPPDADGNDPEKSEDDAATAQQRQNRARSVTSTIVTAPVGLLDERFDGPRRKTLLGG